MGDSFIIDLTVPYEQGREALPWIDETHLLEVSDWSPDGQKLVGARMTVDNRREFVAVYTMHVDSLKKRTLLDTVAWSEVTSQILDPETAERLLYLVMEQGQEWTSDPKSMSAEVWTRVRSEARRRSRRLEEKEGRENEAFFQRRERLVRAEHEMVMRGLEGKLATVTENQRAPGVLNMFQAQIDKARHRHEQQMEQLTGSRAVRVSLSDPIAVCLVHVKRESPTGGTGSCH